MQDNSNLGILHAEKAFAAAEGFFHSGHLLSDTISQWAGRKYSYLIPILPPSTVLLLLALEIYLRCVRALSGLADSEETHLGRLYDSLPDSERLRIERIFREVASHDEMLKAIRKDSKRSAPKIKTTLHNAAHGLDEWMCWFDYSTDEGRPSGEHMGTLFIDTVVHALRRSILEKKPEWTKHKLVDLRGEDS